MADPKTMLIMPGSKFSVSRVVKRSVQVLTGTVLSGATIGVVMVVNGLLSGRGNVMQWVNVWFGFIQRPEIIVTMLLTAMCTVGFIHWQRDKERGK